MKSEGAYCIPGKRIYYRLELMDTSMAIEATGEHDPNIDKFIEIVWEILHVDPDSLDPEQLKNVSLIEKLRDDATSWQDRVELIEKM